MNGLDSNPLVTVVTPSYNQGRFIRATIESVLSQSYPNLEYIIMDGGSTDETAAVVKDYASRLTFISEKDRGQSHAINKGFRMAGGSILSWLNSDDLYLPGAIQAAVDAFESSPGAGAVYGEGYLIDRDGDITARFPCTEPFNLWKFVHLSDYILQQTVYFRRDALDQVGYLDETLHYSMDWDILIRIGLRYPMVYIPEYMGCLREYAEAKTFAGGIRRAREIHNMLRRHTGMRIPPGTYRLRPGNLSEHLVPPGGEADVRMEAGRTRAAGRDPLCGGHDHRPHAAALAGAVCRGMGGARVALHAAARRKHAADRRQAPGVEGPGRTDVADRCGRLLPVGGAGPTGQFPAGRGGSGRTPRRHAPLDDPGFAGMRLRPHPAIRGKKAGGLPSRTDSLGGAGRCGDAAGILDCRGVWKPLRSA